MINITKEQFFEFIKKEDETLDADPAKLTRATRHYLTYFDKYQSTGTKGNWNWSAFLFGYFWLIYRRMCAFFMGYLFFHLILGGVISILFGIEIAAITNLCIGLVFMMICGRYGDYVYLCYATDKISKDLKTLGVSVWNVIAVLLFFTFMTRCVEYITEKYSANTMKDSASLVVPSHSVEVIQDLITQSQK